MRRQRRLVGEMPDPAAHAAHDALLVAAYAAGDATGADLDAAAALVATCRECASLHRDLRAIAAALPELPAPVRSRDFRITPGQAASLRPSGWRRVLAPLAGPRFAFAAPLGATMATLGLAGVLIAGGAVLPLAGSAGSATGAAAPMAAEQAPGDGAGGGDVAGAPEMNAGLESAAPSGPAAAAPSGRDPAASEAPAIEGPTAGSEVAGSDVAGSDVAGTEAATLGQAATPDPRVAMAPVRTAEPARQKTTELESQPVARVEPVPLLAALALVGGLLLLSLRLVARRLVRPR